MTCSSCGREIQEGVRFCAYCGGKVVQESGSSLPLPPPPYHIPSSQAAAAEDRRMALIIVGVVMGFALLIVILAAVLMLILAHEENSSPKMDIRITMAPVGDVTEETMDKSERIIGQRLEALGIEHYNIYSDSGRMVVEIPAVEDIDRVKRIIGSTAQLQFRQVLEVLGAGDPAYDTTEVTRGRLLRPGGLPGAEGPGDRAGEGGGRQRLQDPPGAHPAHRRYHRTRPRRTWLRTPASGRSTSPSPTMRPPEFADLTAELREESEPGNQLAIVLDYEIKSYPRVNEAITGGKGQITGSFTKEEAQDLALVLQAGRPARRLHHADGRGHRVDRFAALARTGSGLRCKCLTRLE